MDMPGNCDALYRWLAAVELRQAQALDALNAAGENAKLAVASLAAANFWAGSCNYLIADPPAYAICEVPALAAVAAATAAVSHYNDQVQEAGQAYRDASTAAAKLNDLISRCTVAESDGRGGDTQGTLAEGQSVLDDAQAISIPEVDSNLLAESQVAVASAENATTQAQKAATAEA
jgi:hypothetical protein